MNIMYLLVRLYHFVNGMKYDGGTQTKCLSYLRWLNSFNTNPSLSLMNGKYQEYSAFCTTLANVAFFCEEFKT